MLQPTKLRKVALRTACGAVALASIAALGASSAKAYTTTGCKWASATAKYANNTPSPYSTAVSGAASAWTSGTDINWVTGSSGIVAYVVAGNYGASGYEGMTTWVCNWLGTYQSLNVQLNRHYMDSHNATRKKVVAMHELGHALGLNHSTASGYPVMASSASNSYLHGTTSLKADDIAGANFLY